MKVKVPEINLLLICYRIILKIKLLSNKSTLIFFREALNGTLEQKVAHSELYLLALFLTGIKVVNVTKKKTLKTSVYFTLQLIMEIAAEPLCGHSIWRCTVFGGENI